MSIKNLVKNLRGLLDEPSPRMDITHLLKAERNKALQEAIDVCNMWKAEEEINFQRESKQGNLTSFGKINLLNLCIQRIEEKITGVRRWG